MVNRFENIGDINIGKKDLAEENNEPDFEDIVVGKEKIGEKEQKESREQEKKILEAEEKAINEFSIFGEKISLIESNFFVKEIKKAKENVDFDNTVASIKEKIAFAIDFLKLKFMNLAGNKEEKFVDFSFSPAIAVKLIYNLPKEKRKEAVDKVKAAIYEQNKKIAEIEKKFISEIRRNPDISDGEIKRMVRETAKENNFSWQQYSVIDEAADNFIWRRRNIKEVKEESKSPEELYRKAFGKLPDGKVEIADSPFCLIFLIKKDSDYSYAYMSRKGGKYNEKEKEEIKETKGVYMEKVYSAKLRNSVVIIRKPANKKVIIHEEEHAIQELFNPASRAVYSSFLERTERINFIIESLKDKTNREIDSLIINFISEQVKITEDCLKDEFLSFFKQNQYTIESVGKLLGENGRYKLFREKRKELYNFLINQTGEEHLRVILKSLDESERRYNYDLDRAVSALKLIEKKRIMKTEEAVAVLRQHPIRRWLSLVREMEKGKKVSKSLQGK